MIRTIIKIDENIKLDGTERKNKSNVDGDSSERTEISNEEDDFEEER